MKWQIKSPEEYIKKVRENISVQEIRAFFILFLFGICLYIPMIVYRLNCSDGNICGIIYRSHSDYDIEDVAGRYLLKYLAHMKSMYVFSWLALILGLFVISLASVLICRMFKIHSLLGIIIGGLFIMVCPCFIATFPYYYMLEGFMLGFLLSVCAAYLLHEKQNCIRMLLASACLFVSLAFYQAYYFVAVVLFLLILIRELLDNKKTWKELGTGLLYQLGCGVISIAVYIIVNKILKMTGLIYYQESRFDFLALLNPGTLFKGILDAYGNFYAYYFTMDIINNSWKARWLINAGIMLAGFVFLLMELVKRDRSWKNRWAIIAAVILIPPVVMAIGILYGLNFMILPTVCLPYIGIWALWQRVKREQGNNLLKICAWGLYACISYLLFIMTVYIAIYQLCMKYYADKTNSMAQRIIERIEEEYPETVAGSPVFICGGVDEGNYPQDYRITQASFILRGTQACEGMFVNNMQGYFAGWNKYLAYNFGVEYEMVWDKGQEIYDSEFYKEMPLWPEDGCVDKTEDGIVVVKLKN